MIWLLSILSSIIIYNLYVQSQRLYIESLTNKDDGTNVTKNKKTNIILLGDSILKNNTYVNSDYSVENILTNLQGNNIYCLAKDGAYIHSVLNQLENIPNGLNTTDSIIFLSIGGNDLLKNTNKVPNIFQKYEELINVIKLRFNKCKIVVMNLYIPPSMQKNTVLRYKIIQWNNLLKIYALKKNIDLITLDNLLYEPIDFVEQYEPSEVGSVKIVKAIMLTL